MRNEDGLERLKRAVRYSMMIMTCGQQEAGLVQKEASDRKNQ